MSKRPIRILLDQNVPTEIKDWLQSLRPSWQVFHANAVGLEGKDDFEVFAWAQQQLAIIITFDEDFADRRLYPVGSHHGVIRLRVWPTTVEEIKDGLGRLFEGVLDNDLEGALIIIDPGRIRIRRSSLEG